VTESYRPHLSPLSPSPGETVQEEATSATRTALSGKAAKAASEFTAVITGFADIADRTKVSVLYDELLARTGYMRALEERGTVEDDARIENLLEFRSAIVESEEDDPDLTLADFLEKTALMSDVDNFDRNADAVTMMTLHSAKGLEFPVVFMPGMEEGLFPSIRPDTDEEKMEEERRLCYVGMTRAMDRLYLLRAKIRTRYGHRDYTIESRFLTEIDQETLDPSYDTPGGDLTGYLHGDLTGDWGGAKPFTEYGRSLFSGEAETRRDASLGFRPSALSGETTAGQYYPSGLRPSALSLAREEIRGREAMRVTDLEPGGRVRHPKFGEGLVIEAEKGFATVMFDTVGRKKLALDLAPLEKI
jgi:DNA helicase-2/ATP-dependent DNA helicase PcrA